MRPVSAFGACIAFAFALASCTSLKPNGLPEQADAARADADAPSVEDAGGECVPARPLGPPDAGGDRPADTDLDLTFAVPTVDFGDSDDVDGVPGYLSIGYDIDGLCTRAGSNEGCRAWSTMIDDGEGGRDNALGRATYAGLGVVTRAANGEASIGRQTTVLRVRGYDGEPDDARIEVAIYAGTLWDNPEVGPTPDWDGGDRWHVSTQWVEAGARAGDAAAEHTARFRDEDAYVTNGTLVARLDVVVNGSAFGMQGTAQSATITARLVPDGGGFSLADGLMTGRRSLVDLIVVSGTLASSSGGEPCPDSIAFEQVQAMLCPFADVRLEGNDPSERCDALSLAMAFEGSPALLGEVFEPFAAFDACELSGELEVTDCPVP